MGKIQKAIAAIVEERHELGHLTQKELAKALGCSQATISHILNGSRTLSEKWIEALCDQLGITLGDIEEAKNRPAETKELRECFARLKRLYEVKPVPGFKSVSRTIDDWLQDAAPSRDRDTDSAEAAVNDDFLVKEPPALDYSDPEHEHDAPQVEIYEDIPFFDDFRVPAGRPDEVVADGRMSVRKVVRHLAKGNRYVIRVTGDSMEPRIQSGDLVLVDYAKEPRSGNIVIAIVNGKAVIKKFLRLKGVPVLRSLNPKYADIVAEEGDEFTIAGVVLKVVESDLT